MRLITPLVAVVVAAALAGPSAAQAAPGDAIPGYEFCGWKDFASGSWTLEDPEAGAFVTAYASGMSCRAARRNVTRLTTTMTPPYAPRRPGYRCVQLINGYEFSSVRCNKLRGKAKFRTQTGS